VKPILLGAVALGGLAAVGAWRAVAWQAAPIEAVPADESDTAKAPPPAAAEGATADGNTSASAESKPAVQAVPDKPLATTGTPMGNRVAVLGILNKRNGQSREIALKPGQSVRVGDVIVRLRACETTAPWEDQKLTGAFVQTDVRNRDGTWRRVFSGWLYKESPSLNAIEDPVYDVWPKSCTMVHPDIGPDTIRLSGSVAGASSAKKSAGAQSGAEPNAPPATPSAESSNAT